MNGADRDERRGSNATEGTQKVRQPTKQNKKTKKRLKILGIRLTSDLSDCEDINYSEKFAEIKQLYKVWAKRILTPLRRIAVLKSLSYQK